MKTTLLLLLAIFSGNFVTVSAQKKDVRGFFVNLNGDTVRGVMVNYVRQVKTPQAVKFRPDNQKEILLTPSIANMFMPDGQYGFYRYEGVRHLNDRSAMEMQIHSFLEMIFESGSVRLFEFKDSSRANYFIQINDQPYEELLYSQWIENNEYVINDNFKKQLKTLFETELNHRNLIGELESLEYNGESLVSFFEKLFDTSVRRKRQIYKPEFFIAAGVSFNRMDASSALPDAIKSEEFGTTVSPVFSVGVQFYDQKTAGRLFYGVSFSTYAFNNEADFQMALSGTTHIRYKGRNFTPCFNLGYHFINTNTIQFYTQAGAGVMLVTNASKEEKYTNPPTNEPVYPSTYQKIHAANLNLNLQAGITVARRFSFWVSYFVPMTLDTKTVMGRHMPIQAGIRYLHKRSK